MGIKYYEDPILGKGRAQVTGGTGGGGGTEYVGGNRINIAGGTTSFVDSADIVNVTGTSVTLQPDTAYKIYATSQAITLNANPPAAGKWAYEGHLEIFVARTGYVVTGTNVVLANALEPDAVNNCAVRFHDGLCIISVEDHVAGYIVVNGATSGEGSLYYGITTSTNDYVAFDASLNGATVDLSGATASGEKHVVGNGYADTILTGDVDCGTSKFTVANLSLLNVAVNGGTMTLGDAYIPNGATVAVSGGRLAVEKVTGAGSDSVIDLGGTRFSSPQGETPLLSNVTITGGGTNDTNGGVYSLYNRNLKLIGVSAYGNKANRGGVLYVTGTTTSNPVIEASNCLFSGNTGVGDVWIGTTSATFTDCKVDAYVLDSGGKLLLAGSNTVNTVAAAIPTSSGRNGSVTISSGAIVDLTGNTNPTPIAPGGGVIIGSNVQIYPSAGSASAVEISGGTYASITSGGVLMGPAHLNKNGVITGGTNAVISGELIPTLYQEATYTVNNLTFSGTATTSNYFHLGPQLIASDCTFTGYDEAVHLYRYDGANHSVLTNCTFSGNTTDLKIQGGYICEVTNCTFSDTVALRTYAGSGGVMIIAGLNNTIKKVVDTDNNGSVIISSGASINLTSSIIANGGITVLTGGCTVNGNAIPAGTYTSIDSNGQPT